MVNITRLHIHYRDLNDKMHLKKIKPTDNTSTLMIKKDIALFLSTIKDETEYYYVVMEIEGDDKPLFRTMTKKIFLRGSETL